MMIPRFEHMAVPQHSAEPWQIRLFRCTSYAPGWFGCPIGFKQGRQVPATPKRCSCTREQALETVFSSVHERKAAHQQMDKQPHPDLPANGVGAVAKEVGELECLLNLLEKHLNVPTTTVELGDRPRAPLQIVGDEDHFDVLSVDFDQGDNAAELLGIVLERLVDHQFDEFVAQDTFVLRGIKLTHHLVLHVVLGTADPPDAAFGELEEMLKLGVGLVKHGDFAGFKGYAKIPRFRAIVVLGRIDNGALRQEALQVEAQVALGGGLATAVLRPVHAVGDQLNRARIYRMDRLVEPTEVSPAYLAFRKA